ncbi:hypothetical protein OH76DRAFT_813715 [Lentinus brumalis]|uniref:Uncharacterized protein n=1 Tax=Lentinus brumalis TaxID=2498619 RepID=A0A371D2I3_9APHY|nr:hypothetical protein OH76DRAFT_813715 [Polyporus brumalis]
MYFSRSCVFAVCAWARPLNNPRAIGKQGQSGPLPRRMYTCRRAEAGSEPAPTQRRCRSTSADGMNGAMSSLHLTLGTYAARARRCRRNLLREDC